MQSSEGFSLNNVFEVPPGRVLISILCVRFVNFNFRINKFLKFSSATRNFCEQSSLLFYLCKHTNLCRLACNDFVPNFIVKCS